MGIEVRELSKSFNYYKKEVGMKNSIKNLFCRERLVKDAVKGISFNISNGEIVGFIGPNGAGKTTTLKMLSGILYPSGGEAYVLGFVPWERRKEFKKQFSIVMGQKSQLWIDLPASESLHLSKYIYELDDKQFKRTIDELSELLDVKHLMDIQIRRLSLGEKMKLELIASLIHRPKVIFLDEPTIGLDFISKRKIRDFIKYYNQENGATIILTSHYISDIEDLCKRTIIINQGEIIFDDDIRKIITSIGDKKLVKLQFSKRIEVHNIAEYGTVKEYNGLSAVIEADRQEVKNKSMRILEHLPVMDFTIEDIPLEEGIIALYKKGDEKVGTI
jgi:ABC-2 type transport system ATP-binding protein